MQRRERFRENVPRELGRGILTIRCSGSSLSCVFAQIVKTPHVRISPNVISTRLRPTHVVLRVYSLRSFPTNDSRSTFTIYYSTNPFEYSVRVTTLYYIFAVDFVETLVEKVFEFNRMSAYGSTLSARLDTSSSSSSSWLASAVKYATLSPPTSVGGSWESSCS